MYDRIETQAQGYFNFIIHLEEKCPKFHFECECGDGIMYKQN